MKLAALLCLLATVALAAAKVTVITHRTETIELLDGGESRTNYVWQYAASFAEPAKPIPGEYSSILEGGTNAELSAEIKATIAADVAQFFKLSPADVEVRP